MYASRGRISPAATGINTLRADQFGALITAGGEYKDITLGQRHFFAFVQTQDMALYTATAAIGLQIYNPPASGVNMVLHKWAAQVWATSATATGMVLAVTGQPLAAPTTTTAATLTGPCLINGMANRTGAACAATSVATVATAPVIVWPMFHNTAAIAITGVDILQGDFQGAFAFAPGMIAIFGALGAAFVDVNLGVTWEEVPIGM